MMWTSAPSEASDQHEHMKNLLGDISIAKDQRFLHLDSKESDLASGLVCFCLFPLPLGVWEGLCLVIVSLPGLFSYHFIYSTDRSKVVVPVLILLFVALWFIL